MGGVIKSEAWSGQGAAPQAAVFNLDDLVQKGHTYLEQVRQQAEALLSDARTRAEQIAEEARQAGRQAALQQAQQELQGKMHDQLASLLPALQRVVRDVEHSKHDWLRHWEQATVELAVAIAERIIRRELAQRPEITLDWLREALTLSLGSGRIKVHLHPLDHRTLAPHVAQLTEEMGELGTVVVVPDEEISPGGCRVTTEFGSVDQQLETQLARIQEELT